MAQYHSPEEWAKIHAEDKAKAQAEAQAKAAAEKLESQTVIMSGTVKYGARAVAIDEVSTLFPEANAGKVRDLVKQAETLHKKDGLYLNDDAGKALKLGLASAESLGATTEVQTFKAAIATLGRMDDIVAAQGRKEQGIDPIADPKVYEAALDARLKNGNDPKLAAGKAPAAQPASTGPATFAAGVAENFSFASEPPASGLAVTAKAPTPEIITLGSKPVEYKKTASAGVAADDKTPLKTGDRTYAKDNTLSHIALGNDAETKHLREVLKQSLGEHATNKDVTNALVVAIARTNDVENINRIRAGDTFHLPTEGEIKKSLDVLRAAGRVSDDGHVALASDGKSAGLVAEILTPQTPKQQAQEKGGKDASGGRTA